MSEACWRLDENGWRLWEPVSDTIGSDVLELHPVVVGLRATVAAHERFEFDLLRELRGLLIAVDELSTALDEGTGWVDGLATNVETSIRDSEAILETVVEAAASEVKPSFLHESSIDSYDATQ